MTDQIPSAPEATASTEPTTLLPDSEPQDATTTSLPDPESSFFFEGEPTPILELPQDEQPSSLPPFLVENQFKQEQEEDRDAALASLDETVLRPFVMPIDFEPEGSTSSRQPPVPTASQTGPASQPTHSFSWRRLGVAAVLAATALAVGIRASGSRKSNVGIFGVPTMNELGVIQNDEELGEESETTEERGSLELSEPAVPLWQKEEEAEPEVEEEVVSQDEEDYSSHTFVWDFRDWTREEDTSDESDLSDDLGESEESDSAYTWNWYDNSNEETSQPNEDHTISWDFDGGNITYYYDDDVVTFDWDKLDEVQQYLDLYDVWGYGSPGGEQGYGSGYGYGFGYGNNEDGMDSDRDRDPGYYFYGW